MNTSSKEPNIIDFMGAVGEQTSTLTKSNVRKCTDRNLLRLSAQWANAVISQRRRKVCDGTTDHFDEYLNQVISTLSPDCALLEVNAISFISSLEASRKRSPLHDDDDMSTEETSLDESTQRLQQELESIRTEPPSLQRNEAIGLSIQSSRRQTAYRSL
eukprot:CAMPEP_0185730018 /NCGR_PEP_ID=MMETSP1171-20130828/8113_1 /TAXON_ID=374046 /ORGANISM="Helicotheca tamensis, Strain CCMP826" /LENGTH=158 /DNA_ID=CAMNT_0028398989 /DNA_START=185 /DNA_END=661 /DNA_ORIENTATION=+